MRTIPPFLHLALEALEKRGGEDQVKGSGNNKEQGGRRVKIMGSIFKRNKQTGWEGDTWYIDITAMASLTLNPRIKRKAMPRGFSNSEKGRS